METNLIDKAVDAAARVLRQRPSALISDVDGTLSPIVASPEKAVVLPACRRALKDLASRLDLVAVVSGRTAADARRMVGLEELLYIGNHGLERWDSAHGYRNDAAAFEGEMRELRAKLDERTRQIPGVRTEDKGTILSLHYRGAPRPDEIRRRILALLDQTLPPGRFVVAEGKMVVEVRPSLALDKGTVIERLVEEHGLGGVVFLGDDLTDVDAMSALRRLREVGPATLGVGVAGDEVSGRLIERIGRPAARPERRRRLPGATGADPFGIAIPHSADGVTLNSGSSLPTIRRDAGCTRRPGPSSPLFSGVAFRRDLDGGRSCSVTAVTDRRVSARPTTARATGCEQRRERSA